MVKNTETLRRGDVILALDDNELRTRVRVTKFVEVYDDGTVVIEVEQPTNWITSPRRYLHCKTVKYARYSTICGKRFLKIDDDLYESPDGRWTIERHDMESECEDAHPVRLTREMVKWISENPSQWPWEARDAAERWGRHDASTGRIVRGYMCPGGEYHVHPEWIPHRHDVENFDHMGAWSATPTDAIEPFIEQV